jgi:HlyD family secretion protein
MKKLLIGVIIFVILDVLLFLAFRNKENGVYFRTEKVSVGDIEVTVSAMGTLNAISTVLVGTQVSGTIHDIYADFNSPVKQGQFIAQIDPAPFEAAVEQAKANLLSAGATVEKAEAALLDSKRTMKRNKELFNKDLISKSEFETSETNCRISQAQLDAAKAQVAQAEAALKYAETNLRYTRIRSPVDGIVVSRNIDVGQTVVASFQTPTLFTIAKDLKRMQIDANVDEADIGKVKLYQPVQFGVDAFPDIAFRGMVSQIRNAPITVQNAVTYDVVIMVDNPELKLRPGMTANVSIIVASKKDVLKIPNAALRFRPSETAEAKAEQKGYGVWILEDGIPKRMEIAIGIDDGSYSELVSDEIREGQEVIVESITTSKEQSGIRRFF